MAEKNMSEKLAESISKLIKKTNTFEKIETLLNGISLFMFITGAVTLYNSYKLHKITEYANISKNKMDDKINLKLDKIIETNEKIIHLQMQLYTSFQNNEVLKRQVSLTEDIENIKTQTIVSPLDDYYELVNECYDNIPCNNSKKATGLNRLFGWK
jgi:hypothetical protein